MINKLEKQFFDTFGIEPKIINTAIGRGFYIEHNRVDKYPQITDRILLELICIINQICVSEYGEVDYYISSNYKDLKQEIISQCNRLANKNAILETHEEDFKQQVRTLFEEG